MVHYHVHPPCGIMSKLEINWKQAGEREMHHHQGPGKRSPKLLFAQDVASAELPSASPVVVDLQQAE
ncbi:StAR-related lipid transfer protein 13 [Clarias magur]|uniref:StAR-related lipid transfer protein 13 n=1 Tax=Clarias magur TaxID=1594786 RepID=A0A8J4UBN7_CLAMG|nr:StAR-related lipid transfer protein 13 [Clarias magur]